MICMKEMWDFPFTQEQKLGARDHRDLLEHSLDKESLLSWCPSPQIKLPTVCKQSWYLYPNKDTGRSLFTENLLSVRFHV